MSGGRVTVEFGPMRLDVDGERLTFAVAPGRMSSENL
jgi:hypothetical protein